jgi:hypothetical protein
LWNLRAFSPERFTFDVPSEFPASIEDLAYVALFFFPPEEDLTGNNVLIMYRT